MKSATPTILSRFRPPVYPPAGLEAAEAEKGRQAMVVVNPNTVGVKGRGRAGPRNAMLAAPRAPRLDIESVPGDSPGRPPGR